MAFPNPFEPHRQHEATDRTIKRLQARIADGDDHLRTDLVEVLMRSAQECALKKQFAAALNRVNEALNLVRQLVQEGQSELDMFLGRVLLFRAAIVRFQTSPEAGVNALNDAIRHFVETSSAHDPQVQNELATALMTKADVLIEPLGAYSAALAAQEQAAQIWRHLLHQGNIDVRQSLISALMACSDSKVQNGDSESAIRDLNDAAEIAEEGIEAGEMIIQPFFIQTLLKLTRLYDQNNDIDRAFETIRSAIGTVKNLIAGGTDQAQMMFTTLYMQCGMLYEKIHDSESALAEYDRCRDVYVELFRDHHWGAAESYIFRTGLANVLMCRGNMLADLKRYPEAEHAFEESVWQYQQAGKHRPQEDEDDTLIPYSIGVVQLNHANLLVVQDKLTEAVELKKKALVALQRRMDAGHTEILPNFLTAYRKLIDIRRTQGETEQVRKLLNNVVAILEKAVDDGKLEYRIDLALAYRQRSILWDERHNGKSAQKDAMSALRVFRSIADDDRDIFDVHISKIQWAELLYQIAVLKVKQNKPDAAFVFFQKEITESVQFYEDGNDFAVVDLLLGYTQYIQFVETFGDQLDHLNYPAEKFDQRLQEVREHCRHGIELSQRKQNETGNNLIAKLFFMMKTAFFQKSEGILLRLQKKDQEASQSFERSIDSWLQLLAGLDNLKAKDKYDAVEKGEPVPDWDIPGGADDPYQDRYVFYINELREAMQLGAKAQLACDRLQEAQQLYEKENALTRELAHNGIHNADRFLIVSLTSHARNLQQGYPIEKVTSLYEEAMQTIKTRFQSGDIVAEDFWVLKRVCKDYREYLREKSLGDEADRLSEKVLSFLSTVQTFPPPALWMSLWQVLEIPPDSSLPLEHIQEIGQQHRKFFKRHPAFKMDKELKKYDRTLKAQLDTIKRTLTESRG